VAETAREALRGKLDDVRQLLGQAEGAASGLQEAMRRADAAAEEATRGYGLLEAILGQVPCRLALPVLPMMRHFDDFDWASP
jgi:hypothetical protein